MYDAHLGMQEVQSVHQVVNSGLLSNRAQPSAWVELLHLLDADRQRFVDEADVLMLLPALEFKVV